MKLIQAGLGGFGRSWAEQLRVGGVELTAVVDPSPIARAWAISTLGLTDAQSFVSLGAALETVAADAVLVVTPPETHHDVAMTALAAGKHVLVEKPLATTLAEARALIAASDRAGRILVVSQNYRFRPAAIAVRQVIAADALGELTAVRVRCLRDTRRLWPADNFRYRLHHPFVLDMSIHHFDLLRAVTGLEVATIYARGWRVPDSPYHHDPAVAAVLTLANGATVVYEGDWATGSPETSWNGDWEFIGERGRLTWTGDPADAMAGSLMLHRTGDDPRQVPTPSLSVTDRAGSLAAFHDAIVAGAEPETGARDNVKSLAIMLGCIASIESETLVALGA